jgi:Nuclease-related domain
MILALSSPPQHERAWDAGARGEEAVGRSLERRTAKGPALIMHDRQMPKGRGNIDHLAVAPGGVFVIDAKAIKGKARISQPLFGKPKLIIAERDRTRLVDGLDRQVDAVRRALAERGYGEVPVVGIFCFTEVHLPWLGRTIRGHRLHYCRGAARQLNRSGPLQQDAIDSIARSLEVGLPPAADALGPAR